MAKTRNGVIAALDIGTSKVVCFVARVDGQGLRQAGPVHVGVAVALEPEGLVVPVLKDVDKGAFERSTPGFSVVSEGVARATEALLRKQSDAAGAQAILVKYVKDLLGDSAVK